MTTGSVLAQFTIHLSVAVAEPVEVSWRTTDGTAKAGVDYAAASGVAIFAPGQTTKTVDVLVYGRAVGSEDRSFFVEMQPPVNAILGAATGECIIHVDTTGSTPVTQVIVPTGPRGIQGKSAYQVWLDLGNTGTEQDFIDSLSPSAQEIAQEVAPLLNVGNSPVTALGTDTLSHPDSMTVAKLARRVAYVGAASVATAVLAAGDNLISHADLSGDAVDFNSINLYPRIIRGGVAISPNWNVEPGNKILIKGASNGDVLYVCQYDAISPQAVKNVVEPLISTVFPPIVESLRRSYADAGYNVVGTFKAGFTYVNANDVGIDEETGKGFTGPAGPVSPGTDPVGGGFVDRSGEILRAKLGSEAGAGLVFGTSGKSLQEELDIIKSVEGASTILTKSGKTIQREIYDINLKTKPRPKGSSKEDGRNTSLGANHISTMKSSDASSTSGTGGFSISGKFIGNGSQNLAAWSLGSEANSFVCQGRIYWGGGVDNAFIGYNSADFGNSDGTTFYSVGFASSGFVFNDKITLQTLVPAANLVPGWYEVSMVYNLDFIFCSICQVGTTKAKSFTVNKTIPKPKNAQIGAYSSADKIMDFRFASTEANNPWCPPFGGGRCIQLPITIPDVNPAGVMISVHLPAGYDPRITHRLAVYCHGSGGTNTDMWEYANENNVLTSLLNAGYVVMIANYASTGWGNQISVEQNLKAVKYIKERYNVFDEPYLIVQSMGGMVGLNTVLVGGLRPSAIAGIYPATNLLWQYQNGFAAAIESAFSFSGAGNFETATAGYDVLNDNQPGRFDGLRMKIWHSYADTIVSRAHNTDLLKTKVESAGGVVDVVTSAGEHGDPSSFDGSGIVDFFSDK